MSATQRDRIPVRFSNDSLNSNDIIDVMHPKNTRVDWLFGWCRSDILTETGKRLQICKILILILVPIFGLWSFTVYGLFGSLRVKSQMEQTQTAVKISVGIGKFLDKIQRERDMSVLYLSILGPQTKTFLRNEYLLTDQALDQLTSWPLKTTVTSAFHSKAKFHRFLNKHRQSLSSKNFDIYVEIAFYNSLIEPFVEWLYDAITESSKASMWQILVSYQKIVTGMEQIGIERALGVVFFVNGGFPSKTIYENYNRNVNIFKSNYRSAVLYSKGIDTIFQKGMLKSGTNLTAVIEKFRYEIQHSMDIKPSITKGQWWFDNMTLYLDTLLIIQQDLAIIINDEVEIVITEENRQ
ncbi:uncharacterized protein LOC121389788 [Gigantopelta aegis]|uniref:uncharacterized protein LOC121389788 n=1 Tax=Gigantopelta aegis TaxID=1735272 RepID=UPI001B887504|nr:uncharacterized protein LOC121389788 [Gigantopelta aegis]